MYLHFSKKIRLNNKLLELKFTPGFALEGARYYVTIAGPDQPPLSFYMQQKNNRWQIVETPGLAGWVRAAESSLQKAIEEHQYAAAKQFTPAICAIP